MDKGAIKNFAVEARKILIKSAITEAGLYGVTKDGCSKAIQKGNDFEVYKTIVGTENRIYGNTIKKRFNLVKAIEEHGFEQVMEETAYTWFNRLIAIRFMEVNDYLPTRVRVLSSETAGKREPDIVTQFLDVDLNMTPNDLENVQKAKEENKYDDAFRMMFIKQCNELNEILPGLFEKTDDYMELLLKISYTTDGVVRMLIDSVSEENFDVERDGQVEIIGWMYQYYNIEQNELVYDGTLSKSRIPKELISAATTIYTPDWAVRYMVENSLGRLWLEGHPNDDLKSRWKYYIDETQQEADVHVLLDKIREEYKIIKPEEIRIVDPCMGSGHILVYAFDVMMQIYENYGYNQREAAKSILENNLYGLDIDERAAQMAYFAVMMKARQYDRRFFSRQTQPHVYAIRESNYLDQFCVDYFVNGDANLEADIKILIDELYDAKEYGSILNITNVDFDAIYARFDEILNDINIAREAALNELMPFVQVARVMAQKYDVVVTNPPYLGSSRFSPKLSDYINKYYSDAKSDLSMVMFKHSLSDFTKRNGFISFITTTSWMFISSFEKLRNYLLENYSFDSIVDFGTELFEGKVGHNPIVAWVNRNFYVNKNVTGVRLVEYCYSRRDEKELEFFNKKNHYYLNQKNFAKIPGSPIAYWVSENFIRVFNEKSLGKYGKSSKGIITGDNNRFLRLWHEVSYFNINFIAENGSDSEKSNIKWYPCRKGGSSRKWYGNNEYVINWQHNGYEVIRCAKSEHRNSQDYSDAYKFKPSVSWTSISSAAPSFRYGCNDLSESAGMSYFTDIENLFFFIGFLNSNVANRILQILSPTMNYTAGSISNMPIIINETLKPQIETLVNENIDISKTDWDNFETSWDFKRHPSISVFEDNKDTPLISNIFRIWDNVCNVRLNKLKQNEEELNRIFIDIYGLQNELTQKVEDKDITIHKADLQQDIKSLISYSVGCMLGRYSLDVEGLAYAGGEWDNSKYSIFIPDADNIIPITDEEYFDDDIVCRFIDFLKVVYGEDTLEENLEFIANALGAKGKSSREVIRSYFIKDFYKDHCKIYQKRPIYWLFDSGKQNGFKALIYMHRYDKDTVGRIRADYLHKTQGAIEGALKNAEYIISSSTSAVDRAKATKDRDKYIKQLSETRIYDQAIAHVALQRIEIDLDDGVKHNYQLFQGVEVSSEGSKKQSVDLLAKL